MKFTFGVEDIGAKPGLSTGNYSKHLKIVLGVGEEPLYEIQAPLVPKHCADRTQCKISVIPPNEILQQAWQIDEELLRDTYDDTEWPEVFHNHPSVQDAGEHNKHLVCGYTLYMDSTPFTKPNSFYGLFVNDLRMQMFHLIAIIVKAELS